MLSTPSCGTDNEGMQPSKRKRLDVAPGKSVSASNETQSSSESDSESSEYETSSSEEELDEVDAHCDTMDKHGLEGVTIDDVNISLFAIVRYT